MSTAPFDACVADAVATCALLRRVLIVGAPIEIAAASTASASRAIVLVERVRMICT
jgi:hypothetical protein